MWVGSGNEPFYIVAFLIFLPSGGTFSFLALAQKRTKMETREGRFLRALLCCSPCSACSRAETAIACPPKSAFARRKKPSNDEDSTCSDSDASDTFVMFDSSRSDKALFIDDTDLLSVSGKCLNGSAADEIYTSEHQTDRAGEELAIMPGLGGLLIDAPESNVGATNSGTTWLVTLD